MTSYLLNKVLYCLYCTIEGSATSGDYGFKISGSQQSFLTEELPFYSWKQLCTVIFSFVFCHICRSTVCWVPEILLPWQRRSVTTSLCLQSTNRILVKCTLLLLFLFYMSFVWRRSRPGYINYPDRRMGYCFGYILLFPIMNKKKSCANTVKQIIPIYVHLWRKKNQNTHQNDLSLGHKDFPFTAQCLEPTVTKG